MGFKESGQSHSLVIAQVNGWMAEWLSISRPNKNIPGIIIQYTDNNGNTQKTILKNELELEALYKICNCSAINIFYLLAKLYTNKISYSDLIFFIKVISHKLSQIREINKTKLGKKEDMKLHSLQYEMLNATKNARKKLHIS